MAAPSFYSVDVLIEPARITWAHFSQGKAIPIPNRYVESLLLPVVRYMATNSLNYRARERHDAVVAQYQDALRMFDMVDPSASAIKEKEGA